MPHDMPTQDRAVSTARFELTAFLEGRTRAWGVFEDRFGRVRRRLSVEMHGRWVEGVFILHERFVYDDTEIETRTWRVMPESSGRFRAVCDDCVGEARGENGTDTVRMSYRFRLKLDRREVIVTFDDRLYRVGDGIAVNRATMSKWGIKLGELSLFFERLADDGSRAGAGRTATAP